jgi:hypothetical protein
VSPLLLNQGLAAVETWDEQAIRTRADRLAVRATKTWPAPQLSADILDAYRPVKAAAAQQYGVEHHPHLANGPMRESRSPIRRPGGRQHRQLKALFPELITEGANGAAINVDVLKALVGDATVTMPKRSTA